jgi:NAD(P)-dependent dehydrogenase (short-subunit alcohol dehydrogenase family)
MKSVLVTGTSKGIGFETALFFARAGYRVHATMRNPAGAPSLAAVAVKENLPINVTTMDDDDASVAEGITAIQAEFGAIDVLVNNAGVESAFRKSMSDEDWVALHGADDATFQRLMSGG